MASRRYLFFFFLGLENPDQFSSSLFNVMHAAVALEYKLILCDVGLLVFVAAGSGGVSVAGRSAGKAPGFFICLCLVYATTHKPSPHATYARCPSRCPSP